MARFVRDEKRTFPFTWLAIGGVFAFSAVWASYAELTTRVPWQTHQQKFFDLELNEAKKAKEAAEHDWQELGSKEPLKSQIAELAKLEAEAADPSSAYGKAKARLVELDAKFIAAESKKTFGSSDLDETYYYRNLAEYARDDAQVAVRKLYRSSFPGEARADEEPAVAYSDPPAPARAGESPAMYRVVAETARMKAHAAQIDKVLETGNMPAELLAALRDSKAKVVLVGERLAVELKHQGTIDAAVAEMSAIDGPSEPLITEKDPAKRDAMLTAARASACQDKADTRNCLKWLVIAPAASKITAVSIAVSKVKRAVTDAELRLARAEERANPKFDPKNPLQFLVGPLEIQQIVNHWMDFKRDVDIEMVDRCQTCHMGTNAAQYTASDLPREFRTHPRREALMASHPVEKFGCTACHQGQGRATDDLAHSSWQLHEHHGKEVWHYDGDHYWEDPLLPVGKLSRIIVDGENDELEVRLGKKKAKLTLEHKEYADETELFSALKGKLAEAVAAQPELAAFEPVFDKLDNRVRIGLRSKGPGAAEEKSRPKSIGVSFGKLQLAKLLGFTTREADSGTQLVVTAPAAPVQPVRAENAQAQGTHVDHAEDYKYLAPSGAAGLQVPDEMRNRFIQALPEIESGCLRCHASDPDLAPRRSHFEHVVAKLAFEKAEVERAKDPAAYAKAHGSDALPQVPAAANELTSLAPTLDQGRALFRQLSCTGCHLLEGFDSSRDAGPALGNVSAKVSPEWLIGWLRNPRGWRAKTSMPNLWPRPLDPASKLPYAEGSPEYEKWMAQRTEETIAIAAFLFERSENPASRPGAKGEQKALRETVTGYASVEGASAEGGKIVFEELGCQGCHANTEGKDLPDAWRARERDVAPTLANLGGKTSADWIAYWVEDPSRYWHGTTMPNLRLSRKEAASVGLYLSSLKSAPAAPAEVSRDEAALVADAKKRAEQVPCSVAGGQALSRVDCGEKLIAQRGCFGCHNIAGFELNAPIGPELTGFAKKDVTTLDFGYAIADHHLQTTETFAALKLDSPRIFVRDRIELRMGDFDLSAGEIRALTVFLKGTVSARPANDFDPAKTDVFAATLKGRQLVNDLNCRGCHMIEGRGADIDGWRGPKLALDLQARAPFLDGQGARVQPEWLFDFLRNPAAHGVRPWLHPEWVYGEDVPADKHALRMPSFNLTSDQWTAIVRYFAMWDRQSYPYQVPEVTQLDKQEKLWALGNMNSTQTGNCLSCHYYGEFPVERARGDLAKMAPNMDEMRRRLRPEWVEAWILRPHNFLPYTKMTAFFASTSRPKDAARWPTENDPFLSPPATGWDTLLPDFRKVTAEEQARLLRDFLFQIPAGAPWPKSGEEASSVMVDPAKAAVAADGDDEEGADDAEKKKKKADKAPQHGALPAPRRF